MKTKSFEWSDLALFLAVARAGRLTAAARRLQIDHSTLSRRVASLETALHTKLFDRRQTGYVLTQQGEKLLGIVESVETSTTRIAKEIGGANLSASGSVRIGAPDGFGSFFLAPRIGRLLDTHPGLEIQLVANPRTFSLSKREADIAIGLSRPRGGKLHARKLVDFELGLYASKDYQARTPLEDLSQLPHHRIITYIQDLIFAPELDYLEEVGVQLNATFQASNPITQQNATRAGCGIGILACFMADPDPSLVRLLRAEFSLIRTLWLIVPSEIRELSRVRVTADFIVEEVGRSNSWIGQPERPANAG